MAPRNPALDDEKEALAVLRSLLGSATAWTAHLDPTAGGKRIDFLLESDSRKLAVEMKASSDVAAIQGALNQVEAYVRAQPDVIPVIATRFMGKVGRELCAEKGIGWFDLSGNADIDAPGLRVLIDGKPNRFKRPGRPSSVFAPKASRIARWLLMYGDTGWTQHQLTENTGLDKGYVSRVLQRMRGQGLLFLRGEQYFVHSRDTLLNVWNAQYDFSKHRVIKGLMPVRSGEQAMQKIVAALDDDAYAATGLAGAWYLDHFATFRTASVYLRNEPDEDLFARLSFTPEERGANVWLIVPNDEGVFHGRTYSEDGVWCAHWVQTYLDLAAHPERSKEAAEHLRSSHKWSAE